MEKDKDGGGVRRHAHLLPQTHKKKKKKNDSHRTSTEHWQKNLNVQKGQETLPITG